MDGVVTATAGVAGAGVKQLFDEVLPELAGAAGSAFDPVEDHRRYVDGRSREDGVRAVLSARGLTLPDGERDDGPLWRTVHGVVARKQELFAARLTRGVRAFPSTVTLLRRLRSDGVRIALVTASRNSIAVLAAAGVLDLFDARVDGGDAERLGLAGKPDPAMFVEAARRLAVPRQEAVVVEDAIAGVQAARRAGSAW